MHDPRDLTKHLAALLRREHGALGDFLVALADFDRERRWLELGHASLFSLLHRELGLSKGAAFYRKTAAELVERYPEIVGPLRDGRLCITSVVELAKVITPENKGEVVPRFFHASKGEAKAISAELRPAQAAPHRDVVTVVRPAATTVLAKPTLAAPLLASQAGGAVFAEAVHLDEPPRVLPPPSPQPPPTPPAVRRDEAEPLTAELRRLHVTVSRGFVAKLAAARDALSHSHPGATTEVVLEAALDLLLAAHERKKGLVKKPRPSPPQPSTSPRHIPAEVKRAVWTRDEGKCQWPLASGGICGSTTRLELDHVVPLARGGASTVGNTRVLCRIHNGLAARQVFGEAWMNRFTSKSKQRGSAGARRGAGASLGLFSEIGDEEAPVADPL
jgi:hypothetical protein